MTNPRRTIALFEQAIALDDVQRKTFLDIECKDDRSLRADVDALIKADLDAGDFFHGPSANPAIASEKHWDRIGSPR